MWQKTYRVHLTGAKVLHTGVIKVWKEHFSHDTSRPPICRMEITFSAYEGEEGETVAQVQVPIRANA